MDTAFFVVLSLSLVAGSLGMLVGEMVRRSSTGLSKSWRRVATELELKVESNSLQGTIDGFSVRVDCSQAEAPVYRNRRRSFRNYVRARIVIQDTSGRIPSDLCLSREPDFKFGQDILTHDPDFDSRILVRGDELQALALLDGGTRGVVLEETDKGVEVHNGEIRGEVAGVVPDRLVGAVRDLIDFGVRLRLGPGEVQTRLSKNATKDHLESVRVRNLILLQGHFPGSGAARDASRALLEHATAQVRLLAAAHLGKEGAATLAVLVGSEEVEDGLRATALQHLLACDGGAELASIQPTLLRCLECKSHALCLAAIEGLGKSGTVEAVEPLKRLIDSVHFDRGLSHAARSAIQGIQARLGGAEPGRLSLPKVAPQDGALSLAPEEGRLSVPRPKPAPYDTEALDDPAGPS